MVNIKKQHIIDTKPPNVFDCLRSLSQESKDLMDEIEEENDDIDDGKLDFLVITEKNLTLTLLINHWILSQLFVMVKFH